MQQFTDQLGRTVELNATPTRIISLVPSQTELLHYLGLKEEVVGLTKFCIHPSEWFKSKTRVGGTKQLNIEKIIELQPHLVIANKEENTKDQIEAIEKLFPVWISDVNNLQDALQMIISLGAITGKHKEARLLATAIEKNFLEYKSAIAQQKINACYLIWKDPYMTVGGDTFINCMMDLAGFYNVFHERKRYPEITIDEINESGCQALLLSSEPYPFSQKHADELQDLLPGKKILLVDGEMFSWYGSRLLMAPPYFQTIHSTFGIKK